MKFVALLFSISCFITSDARSQHKILTGCSGKSIETYGIQRDVYGTWMGRSTWEDLKKGNWLWTEESGLPAWRKAHFERATDIGVPLIPTDGSGNLDQLLKESIQGKQDSTYILLGSMMASYGTKTVFARIWWEFNMHPVEQSPELFVKAWQRAVPLIRKGFAKTAQKDKHWKLSGAAMQVSPILNHFIPETM